MMSYFFKRLSALSIMILLLAGCQDSPRLGNERIQSSITVDGLLRTYLLYLPSSYDDDETREFSLVIGLHGAGGSGDQFDRNYGLTGKADNEQFTAAGSAARQAELVTTSSETSTREVDMVYPNPVGQGHPIHVRIRV